MTASLQRNEPAQRASAGGALNAGWLLGPGPDAFFIVGLTILGLGSAGAVIARPSLWLPILIADLWFLGYHHVVSTFTRLAGTAQSRADHRALLTWVPLLVVALVAAAGYGLGAWALTTTYFYWQWWHYTRQSWGISRVYERKGGLAEPLGGARAAQAAFYLVPLWGVLSRSAEGSQDFLGSELRALPVPSVAVNVVAVAAVVGIVWSIAIRVQAWRAGRLPLGHTLYLISHYVVFVTAYVLVDDINYGWLGLNIWHNAQHILFVWYFNNQRQTKSLDRGVVAWFSATHRVGHYMVASVALSSLIYFTLQNTIAAVVAPIVIYQTINFHHYIVESIIWKVRKAPMQTSLGLSAPPSQ